MRALDARQLGALLGRSPTGLCSELSTTGRPCAPCGDGAPTCLAFRFDDYTGRAVTGP